MRGGLVGLSVFAAAWLALCIWTGRRLLFRADVATRRGALRYGVPLWLGLAASNWIGKVLRESLSPGTLLSLAILLVIGFPFSMWMGHFLDRMFRRPPERRPDGRGR